jgi:asparagine synthase (glutamine-hydrolysing)
MSSFLGVIQINYQQINPELVKSQIAEAKYIVPRKINSWENSSASIHIAEIIATDHGDSSACLYESESYVIVADIILYNRTEVMKMLWGKGIDDTVSDTIILLESFDKWGLKCLSLIKGDYSFLIFNKKTGDFFCARDPLGIRPFFYTITPDSFVFGSELRFVKASFQAEPETNFGYILDTLVTCKSDTPETAYKRILRIKPAHYLLQEKGKFLLSRFWQFSNDRNIICKSMDDYESIFRNALIKAIQVRIRGTDSIGTELSGGLDSSAITGIANFVANSGQIPITAFSNILPRYHPSIYKDESDFIHQQLHYSQMDWEGIEMLNQNTVELIRHALKIQGCITQQNFHIFNKGLLEAVSHKKIGVLLSGFGGDEMISARISFPWNETLDVGQFNVFYDELFFRGITFHSFFKGIKILGKYLISKTNKQVSTNRKFSHDLLEKRFNRLPIRHDFSDKHNLRTRFYDKYKYASQYKISQQQVTRLTQNYISQHLDLSYAAAAQYGIEYRYPLLDTELLETYLSFPSHVVNHHGLNRYIFRSGIKNFVPEKIWSRKDKGYLTIPHFIMRLASDRDIILATIEDCSNSAYLREIFEFDKFPEWYGELIKQDEKMNSYFLPGAFCNYLMMMLYFKDHG